jgi:hypothetical protein
MPWKNIALQSNPGLAIADSLGVSDGFTSMKAILAHRARKSRPKAAEANATTTVSHSKSRIAKRRMGRGCHHLMINV